VIGESAAQTVSESELSAERIRSALRLATAALLDELGPDGHWSGELSSSALSTATAVTALAAVDRDGHRDFIASGLRWLAAHANADGGWGDTVRSKSNISTTALCWAAFGAAQADGEHGDAVARAGKWLDLARGAKPLAQAIEERYGKDRTFSVPILMTLALSGRLGADGWERVIPLPFELAALPHQVFGAVRLPVVSYALPALIAIGQTIHHHHPTHNPLLRWIRDLARDRTLRVLTEIQPANGGFLEATPLTSFVTMSLAAMGLQGHPVTQLGADFLRASMRQDGSWPIDTNLATWVTTLSTQALASQPQALSPEERLSLREWLLGQQYRTEHLYTHAAPGGWAWTDLPGGVPDADDTPGALLALTHLGAIDPESRAAGLAGMRWLLALQNSDGGIPTFCRGWGALPFDRSSADLTAHTLRAWSAWLPQCDEPLKSRTLRAIPRALRFLQKTQRPDGSWLPLWFGNEHAHDDENPLYGTAKVAIAFRELRDGGFSIPNDAARAAERWLAAAQNEDGGWSGVRGGPPSVEETALATEALVGTRETKAAAAGVRWLLERVEAGTWKEPAPIVFYFAKLWYYEKLYPMIFTVGALGRAAFHL
jgi:squalene-hopene/tetraprenyl-beta-curcumene cyclase